MLVMVKFKDDCYKSGKDLSQYCASVTSVWLKKFFGGRDISKLKDENVKLKSISYIMGLRIYIDDKQKEDLIFRTNNDWNEYCKKNYE